MTVWVRGLVQGIFGEKMEALDDGHSGVEWEREAVASGLS